MINLTLAFVTVVSLVLAAVASVVAWTTKRDERQRATIRVARLAAAIRARTDDLPLRQPQADSDDEHRGLPVEPAAPPHSTLSALGIVAVVAVGAITGLVLAAAAGSSHDARPVPSRAERQANQPLELVALEHELDDNRLVVRGIVRNPGSAVMLKGLTAVVLVFSRDGDFIASGRAPAGVAALSPGAETPFVVTLPDVDSVDRYRVSFRTDERILPHVDRRDRNTMARRE
jgi:hypothetical protein